MYWRDIQAFPADFLASANPLMRKGTLYVALDTGDAKIGDGETTWNDSTKRPGSVAAKASVGAGAPAGVPDDGELYFDSTGPALYIGVEGVWNGFGLTALEA